MSVTVTMLCGRVFKSAASAAEFYGVSPYAVCRALDVKSPEVYLARHLLNRHMETDDPECLDKAAEILNSLCARNPLDDVAVEISEEHGLLVADIRGNMRSRKIMAARKAFTRLAAERGYSTRQLAKYLNRDHTTILNLRGVLARNQKPEE